MCWEIENIIFIDFRAEKQHLETQEQTEIDTFKARSQK